MLELLRLQAELACESHGTEHVDKALRTCIRLLRLYGTKKRAKDLYNVMVECVQDGDSVHMTDYGVYVNGTIDVAKLARMAVWCAEGLNP